MKTIRQKKSAKRVPLRRNRKLQSQGFLFPAREASLLVVLTAFALGYLWLCSSTEALSKQIKVEEHELEQLRRKVAHEEVLWNDMIGPRSLRLALRKHNLDMNWPRNNQVIHIRDMALWEANGGQLNVYGQLDPQSGGVDVP
jgi:hypothetical protein